MAHVAPYTVLADCYDAVMEHVDYPGWVDYIEEVLAYHGHEPGHVLELACGTGTFAALFSENSGTASYVAVDGSAHFQTYTHLHVNCRASIHLFQYDRKLLKSVHLLIVLLSLRYLLRQYLLQNDHRQSNYDWLCHCGFL